MPLANIAFIALVVCTMSSFAAVLGFVSWWSNQPPRPTAAAEAAMAEDSVDYRKAA